MARASLRFSPLCVLLGGLCLALPAASAGPLHCVGSVGAECVAGNCDRDELHSDITLDAQARRGEVCIGESCYTGRWSPLAGSDTVEGDFTGRDARAGRFSAHVALTRTRDAVTLTWSDGVSVAMAFGKCEAQSR